MPHLRMMCPYRRNGKSGMEALRANGMEMLMIGQSHDQSEICLNPAFGSYTFSQVTEKPNQKEQKHCAGMIAGVQEFYADEMERHGFGRKTFTVETDTGGIPVVHFIRGKFKDDYLLSGIPLSSKCGKSVLGSSMIFVIHTSPLLIVSMSFYQRGGAVWQMQPIFLLVVRQTVLGEEAEIRRQGKPCLGGELSFQHLVAVSLMIHAPIFINSKPPTHELAHAFGLAHDHRADNHQWGPNSKSAIGGTGHHFSHCDTEWLSVSRFFNEGPFPEDTPGSIELLAGTKAHSQWNKYQLSSDGH